MVDTKYNLLVAQSVIFKIVDTYKKEGIIGLDEYSYFIRESGILYATAIANAIQKFICALDIECIFNEQTEVNKLYKETFRRLKDDWLGINLIDISDLITVNKDNLDLIIQVLDEEHEKFINLSQSDIVFKSLNVEMSDAELELLLSKIIEAKKNYV